MKTIYKYNFKIAPYIQEIDIPAHGTLLHIDVDTRNSSEGAMWFEVTLPEWPKDNSEVAPELRRIQLAVVGTGGIIPGRDFTYYRSFKTGGEYIWHIYLCRWALN